MVLTRIDDFFKKLEPKSSTKVNKISKDVKFLKKFNILQSWVILEDIMKRSLIKYQDNGKQELHASFTINLPPVEHQSLKVKQESEANAEEKFSNLTEKSEKNSEKLTKSSQKLKLKNYKNSVKKPQNYSKTLQKSSNKITQKHKKSKKSPKQTENPPNKKIRTSRTIEKTCDKCGKSHYIGWKFKVHKCTPKCEFCGKIFKTQIIS